MQSPRRMQHDMEIKVALDLMEDVRAEYRRRYGRGDKPLTEAEMAAIYQTAALVVQVGIRNKINLILQKVWPLNDTPRT